MKQAASPGYRASTVNPRVLVVDDNPDITSTLAVLLREDGFETSVVHNGVDALTSVERYQPDVVLLDLNLPRMNGIQACAAIRQMDLTSQPAIIAMTGYGADRDVEFCLTNGFDGHSVKGRHVSELKALIHQLLARK
ncbi:response regulator [Schlesneria paludicola]|uniref:response regulator n=1 Tax=Schlesneria paludicola TaxID=360056 RepID=UPI000299EFC5|nr:response regulator [Schlesneria paludicola]